MRTRGLCLSVIIASFAVPFSFVWASSPEMDRLSFLIGDWHSVERSTSTGRDPIDFTLDGRNEWTLGGNGIKIEETLHLPEGRKGHNFILILWDSSRSSYVMHWYSPNSPTPRTFMGTLNESKLVLEHVPAEGQGNAMRITYERRSESVIDAKLEVKSGDEWQVRTVATYTKKLE